MNNAIDKNPNKTTIKHCSKRDWGLTIVRPNAIEESEKPANKRDGKTKKRGIRRTEGAHAMTELTQMTCAHARTKQMQTIGHRHRSHRRRRRRRQHRYIACLLPVRPVVPVNTPTGNRATAAARKRENGSTEYFVAAVVRSPLVDRRDRISART